LPSQNYLAQNAPNPFNPTTMIEFGVAINGTTVRLDIFDVTGRRIRTLVDGSRSAGVWRESWDGRTANGSRVSSGVYFYRLRVGAVEFTRRMTLVE
jgi:flagellar hook assembly protein FlgD